MRPLAPVLIFICLLLFAPLTAADTAAEGRFAEGFQTVAWGTHKDKLPDLGLSPKALKNIYADGPSSVLFMKGKGNLTMTLDSVPLLSIFLRFQDQIFCGVDMVFNPKDRATIQALMKADMGAGKPVEENVEWTAGSLIIVLTDRELMIRHSNFDKQ